MSESYWQGTKRYGEINGPREIMMGAHSKIVYELLQANGTLDKSKTVIEIGAGTGALANIVNNNSNIFNVFSGKQPWGHVIQSDPNIDAITQNSTTQDKPHYLSNKRQSKKLIADALDLPFAQDSLDYVVGLACLDVMKDPEQVLGSIFDKLKPGGKFIHFQDIVPDPVALIPYAYHKEGFVPLPVLEDTPTKKGEFQIVPIDIADAVMNSIQSTKNTNLTALERYTGWYRSTMLRELAQEEQELIRILSLGNFDTSTISELFAAATSSYAERSGFDIVISDWIENRLFVYRDQLPKQIRNDRDIDIIKNQFGVPIPFKFNPRDYVEEIDYELQDKIMMFGQIHALVLEKPLID